MKTFTRDYNLSCPESESFNRYFGSFRPCVYDIETSGLSYENSKVILTAMLFPTDNGVRVTQFLAEDPYEEDLVLNATLEFISEEHADYLITYNGDSFDIPFTNQRLHTLHLDGRLSLYDLDLYRFFKKHTILPGSLDSLSQKSVESYFGIGSHRKDTITGRESVELFREYALTGNSVIEKVILTHNREDVVQLYKVLVAAAYRDFKYVLKEDQDFHSVISSYGFPGASGRLTIRPSLMKKKLKIRGRQLAAPVNAAAFPESSGDLRIEFERGSSSYEAELSVINESGNIYADLRALNAGIRNIIDECPQHIRELDGYVNDYLILAENGIHRYPEINAFSEFLVDSSYRLLTR